MGKECTDRDDRAEYLLDHRDRPGVRGEDDGRLHKVALRVVAAPADEHLAARVPGLLDVPHSLVVGLAVAARRVSLLSARNDDDGGREGTHMTGPMKLLQSCGAPTLILAISARSWSLKPPFHADADTYSRESAEHFWPAHRHHSS